MPGTGKTKVIVEIIEELVARGKSVLISYPHSAVDNITLEHSDRVRMRATRVERGNASGGDEESAGRVRGR